MFFKEFLSETNYRKLFSISLNEVNHYRLSGDPFQLSNDIRNEVLRKIQSVIKKKPNQFVEFNEKRYFGYLYKSIRNMASDIKDKQNNSPIDTPDANLIDSSKDIKSKEFENIEITARLTEKDRKKEDKILEDNTDAIKDDNILQDEKANNKMLISLLKEKLDDESMQIWFYRAEGYTFVEIGKELNKPHQTIQTKWTQIRLLAKDIYDK
jgi:hypothetical protein